MKYLIFWWSFGSILAQNCGDAPKCQAPNNNVLRLTTCMISDIMSMGEVDKVLKSLITQICGGSNIQKLHDDIQKTFTDNIESSTYAKAMQVVPKYNSCIEENGSNLNKVLKDVTAASKVVFKTSFQDIKKIANKYKKDCKNSKMMTEVYKYGCGKFNKNKVQLYLNEFKKQQNKKVFDCAPKHLANMVFWKYYKV